MLLLFPESLHTTSMKSRNCIVKMVDTKYITTGHYSMANSDFQIYAINEINTNVSKELKSL